MKRISVKLVGSDIAPFTIHVTPDMTAGEILAHLNLADYTLAIPPAPNRYFAPYEAVYEELMEGDFLLAVSQPSAPCTPAPHSSPEEASRKPDALKRLTIRIFGSKRPPVHVQLQPGITPAYVLASLKLSGYVLVPAGSESLAHEIFKHLNPSEDDLYERAQDGGTLIALPAYEAARLGFADMLRNFPLKEFIR